MKGIWQQAVRREEGTEPTFNSGNSRGCEAGGRIPRGEAGKAERKPEEYGVVQAKRRGLPSADGPTGAATGTWKVNSGFSDLDLGDKPCGAGAGARCSS